jgi:hypothetical protein
MIWGTFTDLLAIFTRIYWMGNCTAPYAAAFALEFTRNTTKVDDLRLTETIVAFNRHFFNSSSFLTYQLDNETSVGFQFSNSTLNASEIRSLTTSLLNTVQANDTDPAVPLRTDVKMMLIRWGGGSEATGLIASWNSTINFLVKRERFYGIFEPNAMFLTIAVVSSLLVRCTRRVFPDDVLMARIVLGWMPVNVPLVLHFCVHFTFLLARDWWSLFISVFFLPCVALKLAIRKTRSIVAVLLLLGTILSASILLHWMPKLFIVAMFLSIIANSTSSINRHELVIVVRCHLASITILCIFERWANRIPLSRVSLTSIVCLAVLPPLSRLGRSVLKYSVNRFNIGRSRYRSRLYKKKLLAEAAGLSRQNQTKTDEICDPCPICREEIANDLLRTRCNHRFHKRCLHQWLAQSSTCPMCRVSLSYLGDGTDAAAPTGSRHRLR